MIYAKRPFAGPGTMLAYLSRYTHRVALSNRRLIAADRRGVTFTYKDYRREGSDRYRTMTLSPHEFIRRFLIHVLPKGFHRIRHYGLFASAERRHNIAQLRQLLAGSGPEAGGRGCQRRRDQRLKAARPGLPLLRRPHGDHRDVRARRHASVSTDDPDLQLEDRHL